MRTALRSADGRVVGELELWVAAATLHARVSATAPMTKVQLHIVPQVGGFPTTRSGNPVPGRFRWNLTPTNPVTSWAFEVDLADVGVDAGEAVFAALHAEVGERSAWAGALPFPGASWATYLAGVVNRPPTAAFSVRSGEGRLVADVDASASADPDGAAITYHWWFGDDTELAQGPAARHAYAALGTYVITLTVTDEYGATASAASAFTPTTNVVRVSVLPTSFGIPVGDRVTLTATAMDAAGQTVSGPSASWGPPSSPAVSVSAAGLVTGLARGFASVSATMDGVTGRATLSVYTEALLDSVSFTFRLSDGNTIGWTETTQPVGRSVCVRLFTFDPSNITNALRWEPAVSDGTIMAIDQMGDLPESHCFRALRPGTVTVFGSFGGKTASKIITVE